MLFRSREEWQTPREGAATPKEDPYEGLNDIDRMVNQFIDEDSKRQKANREGHDEQE